MGHTPTLRLRTCSADTAEAARPKTCFEIVGFKKFQNLAELRVYFQSCAQGTVIEYQNECVTEVDDPMGTPKKIKEIESLLTSIGLIFKYLPSG
jgi:hypothetical protein